MSESPVSDDELIASTSHTEGRVTDVLTEASRQEMNDTVLKVVGKVSDQLVAVVEEIVRAAAAIAFEEGARAGWRASFNNDTDAPANRYAPD